MPGIAAADRRVKTHIQRLRQDGLDMIPIVIVEQRVGQERRGPKPRRKVAIPDRCKRFRRVVVGMKQQERRAKLDPDAGLVRQRVNRVEQGQRINVQHRFRALEEVELIRGPGLKNERLDRAVRLKRTQHDPRDVRPIQVLGRLRQRHAGQRRAPRGFLSPRRLQRTHCKEPADQGGAQLDRHGFEHLQPAPAFHLKRKGARFVPATARTSATND